MRSSRKEAVNPGDKTPRPRLRPGLLALGPFLATLPLYAPNFRLYARFASEAGALGPCCLAMAVTIGLLGLACAAAAPRRPGWHGFGRRVLWGAALGYMLAFAGLLACLLGYLRAAWVPCALGAAAGACTVPVAFAWIACFPDDLRAALLHAGLSCGIAALITWALGYAPAPVVVGATAVATAVGVCAPAAMVSTAQRAGAANGANSAGEAGSAGDTGGTGSSPVRPFDLVRNLLSIVWLPFLGFLTFVFITGGYRFPEGLMAVDTETTGALLACALTIAVCLPRYRTPLALIVEKIVVPACVACSVVLGGFPDGSPIFLVGAASVFAPLIFLGVYAGALFAVVSKRGEFPRAFAVGLALFLVCLFSTLGVTVSNLARVDLGPWIWVVICAYFGLIVVNLGVSSWRRIAHPPTEAIEIGEPPAAVDQTDDGDPVERRVRALAEANGLSGREAEILGYLARGYNSTYIAKTLFISANTVRSHTYNLYRKLGVTSRGQLLELVNE